MPHLLSGLPTPPPASLAHQPAALRLPPPPACSTQQAVDAHRQRVAAARDAMERAGVAASDARQYVAEREAAAEQAQVRPEG